MGGGRGEGREGRRSVPHGVASETSETPFVASTAQISLCSGANHWAPGSIDRSEALVVDGGEGFEVTVDGLVEGGGPGAPRAVDGRHGMQVHAVLGAARMPGGC